MKRFGKLIVTLRIPIIILCFALVIPSVIGILGLRINYDLLSYLPPDLETMQGQDILMDEFGKGAYAIFICNGMNDKDVAKLKTKMEEVEHVDNVVWYDTLIDASVPRDMLPAIVRNTFDSLDDGQTGTMMFIFFDTSTSADETLDAVSKIRLLAGEQCFLSSMSAVVLDMKLLVQNEMMLYIVIAALLTSLVLAFMMDSYLVPVLIMLNIGISILYNLGTNFIQGEISFITMALVAVLQLGVTMDYSIFLYSSFQEQKRLCEDRKEAMANAIAATIVSITGSSLTTVAGFVALCFMSFTLGMDLGVVMAKGVVLGVVGCVTLLPSLMLCCDNLIARTMHKPLTIPTAGIASFAMKHHRIFALAMVLLWIPALYGNNHTEVYYKIDQSLPEQAGSRMAGEVLQQEFDMKSMSMIIVDKEMPHVQMQKMLDEINKVEGVNFALSLDYVLGSSIPGELVPDKAKEIFEGDNWKLILLSSKYELATDEVNEQCNVISGIIKSYDPGGMLIGETACTKDLIEVCDHDFQVVNIVSIGAIFVLIFLVLRSISLPVILVAVIELAIYINMGISYYIGQTLPFIASVCVGTIQLGATVDYAILMTTRYKTERLAGHTKKEATNIALETSIHSVVSSALGFFAATIGVALYSSADLIASICMLLARGALISMVVVILMLPSMYMIFDKLICRTTKGMSICLKEAGQTKRREEEL